MSQWTNKFLTASEQQELDPITFAITRFCLNIALSYKDVSWEYLYISRVHMQLIHYMTMKNILIVGPAFLGLIHISLYPPMKIHIASANIYTPLLHILTHTNSASLLALGCKLLASLALEPSNKPLIAHSGCLHALYDLLLGTHIEIDIYTPDYLFVQYYSLCALVNALNHSDASRMLSVELKGIKPLLTLIQTNSHSHIHIYSIRTLCNMAYNNHLSSHEILLLGVGEVLGDVLESVDVSMGGHSPANMHAYMHSTSGIQHLQDEGGAVVAHSILALLSNMCNSDTNQTHIGECMVYHITPYTIHYV
ncbi:hypothetical protein EON65_42700 [archaeon]|nr:MAG: hypothetical protein EON65_42700 [archaeon]